MSEIEMLKQLCKDVERIKNILLDGRKEEVLLNKLETR